MLHGKTKTIPMLSNNDDPLPFTLTRTAVLAYDLIDGNAMREAVNETHRLRVC